MNAMKPAETESFDAAELGAMMREMRENLGHDLESVASDLRIRLVYIEAIEAGRLSDLPGNAYISGFLRAYSDFLGLDGAEIVRRFKMAGAEISTQSRLHLPSPVEEGRLPTASILLVAAVIAAAAYGGWYYLSFADKNPIETVAKLPRELSNLVDGARNQSAPTSAVPQPSDVPPPTSVLSPPPVTVPTVTAQAEKPGAADTMNEATSADPAADGDNQPAVQSDAAVAAAGAAASEAAGISPSGATEAPAVSAIPAAEALKESIAAPVAKTVLQPAANSLEVANTPTALPEFVVTPKLPAPAPAPKIIAKIVATPDPATRPAADIRTAAVAPPERQNPSAPVTQATATERPTGGVRIVVRATADSYVAVRTGDNEPLFSQLMRPGDSYEVPSGADLLLETGNAGGLQITIDGKRVPPLGSVGEIRRNIPLDAEKLLRGLD
jgi:cytoskeletal protein RodZ